MDDQGLIPKAKPQRISGRFLRVPPAEFDMIDLDWLKQAANLTKIEYRYMLEQIDNENWDLWRLPYPAKGVAVSYPKDGLLFVYYLHGKGLFGSITNKDLLDVARAEGLEGLRAEVRDKKVERILRHLGFVEVDSGDDWKKLELRDGR